MNPALIVFLTIMFVVMLIVIGIFSLYFYAISKVSDAVNNEVRKPYMPLI